MHLARIEMTGFKSFADKTVIEFDRGMTAVVGPNGSGKSNLSEAIRWVLGEQSAKSLRGSRMEDVIFNGTQDRKAVNLAKVTLVLNNEDRYLDYDFSEISITRSYNRNGDSHYFINNEPCRLKDIVDLLLDSGLGKNSFAMISQGKVETIFLNKPEERRSIFEEAAGVQKYQLRKTEAERKMNRSSDHLSRVKDIIHELEQQLKPLKKQKEAALVYQEKKELLKQLEISLYCYQVEQYRQKWQQSQAQQEQVAQEIGELTAKLQSLTQLLESEQMKLDTLIQSIDTQAEQQQQSVQLLEQEKAQQQMLEQRITFHEISQQDKQLSYSQALDKKEHLLQMMTQLNERQVQLATQLNEQQEHEKQLQHEHHLLTQQSGEQVEQLRADLIDVYQQEATLNNQLNEHRQRIQQLTQKSEQLDSELKASQFELQQAEQQYTQLATQSSALDTQHQTTVSHYQQLLEKSQVIRTQKETVQQQLFTHERRMQFLDTKVQTLRQMQEDYAGYYAGVRAVMTNTQHLDGIEGTVADLIDVPSQYQVAIDTALGATLQHIVVRDDHSAKEAIRYLKQQQVGRATFLPRSNIKARTLPTHHYLAASEHEGFVGIAQDIVSFDMKNQAIIGQLLGTTVVMSRLEYAQSLAKKVQQQVKIVTLDGEVLMPGGAVTGGRTKQQTSSMLSRQTELKEYEVQLEEAVMTHAQLEQQWHNAMQEDSSIQQQLQALQQQVTQSTAKAQEQQQQLFECSQHVKQMQRQCAITQDEWQQSHQQLQESQEFVAKSETELEQVRTTLDTLKHDLSQLTLNEEDRQSQVKVLEQTLHQVMTQLAVDKMECQQVTAQYEQMQAELSEVETLLKAHTVSQTQDNVDYEALVTQLTQLKADISEKERQVESSQKHLQSLRQERQTRNQAYREHEQAQRELSQHSQKVHQQQAKLQGNIEKYEALIDNHLDYLNQEYQLSYEAASQLSQPVELPQQAMDEVKQLKRQMEQLGPINLAAIEDYDVLDERYQHLLEQQEDLLTAMSQLQQTMDEMDSEVTKRFSDTFNQINYQFQRTFKKLFAGGQASLELTNPDDLLTTGVDIIAQPPGKRKQNLALLSGGERAFTAIALLFAILETKPVPFCVLDEVEAALDDANVYRYGQYLQNFTENTQFIVITHRKGTMEHADVLYGVTMEQSGVSKLASVKLTEGE